MKVGFTGTQRGATNEQRVTLASVFDSIAVSEFHHGDCVGADEQAHEVARHAFVDIVIHPPTNDVKRAWCEGKKVTVLEPADYLLRNRAIVDSTDMLIACPEGEAEVLRSGTWSTVRYARRVGKKVLVITPAGDIV